MPITRDQLLTLEAYSLVRLAGRAQAIAHRRLRSVQLGAHLTLQFEDMQTICRQIQEMLHAGKIFDAAGIQAEIDAYAPLLPDGSNWKATLLIAYPDPQAGLHARGRLASVSKTSCMSTLPGMPASTPSPMKTWTATAPTTAPTTAPKPAPKPAPTRPARCTSCGSNSARLRSRRCGPALRCSWAATTATVWRRWPSRPRPWPRWRRISSAASQAAAAAAARRWRRSTRQLSAL